MTPLQTTADDIRFRPLQRNALFRKALLDELVADDHPVRLIDAYVKNLDTAQLLEPTRAWLGRPRASIRATARTNSCTVL